MDSLSLGMPARFQKSSEATFNYPHNNHPIGHDGREIAVTMPRYVGHDPAKSPVTMPRNTQWISKKKNKWSPYYLSQVQSFMGRYVRDTPIGKRPVSKVTLAEISDLIGGVAIRTKIAGEERKKDGAPTVALLLRMWCNQVFRLAVKTKRAEVNPLYDTPPSDLVDRPPVKNNLALSKNQLQVLLTSFASFSGQRTTGIAMQLLMLTLLRTGELRPVHDAVPERELRGAKAVLKDWHEALVGTNNLRDALEVGISANLDMLSHADVLKEIAKRFPHSIKILPFSYDPLDDCNCVMYALALYPDPSCSPLGRYYANTNFVLWLIEGGYLTLAGNSPDEGSLAIYFKENTIKHIGVLVEAGHIISKWGAGHLYEHPPLEVPKCHGDEVRYYTTIDSGKAFELLKQYH